jgi:hypothetical protein
MLYMDSDFATSHETTLSCTIYYMTVSAAESNKIGPDGKAGSGPKKHGNGDKMSCSDRGTASLQAHTSARFVTKLWCRPLCM